MFGFVSVCGKYHKCASRSLFGSLHNRCHRNVSLNVMPIQVCRKIIHSSGREYVRSKHPFAVSLAIYMRVAYHNWEPSLNFIAHIFVITKNRPSFNSALSLPILVFYFFVFSLQKQNDGRTIFGDFMLVLFWQLMTIRAIPKSLSG